MSSTAEGLPESRHPSDTASDRELIGRWMAGDRKAGGEIYERYVDRLLRAAGNVQASAQPSAESAVQSAFKSFLRRTREKKFTFDHDDSLWKVLVTITLNKCRLRIRRRREVSGSDLPDSEWLQSHEPGPDDVAAYLEARQRLFDRLSDREKQYIQLRETGLNQSEIAREMNVTTRHVRRIARLCEFNVGCILNLDASSREASAPDSQAP